eukprot:gene1717-1065_t
MKINNDKKASVEKEKKEAQAKTKKKTAAWASQQRSLATSAGSAAPYHTNLSWSFRRIVLKRFGEDRHHKNDIEKLFYTLPVFIGKKKKKKKVFRHCGYSALSQI